MVTTVGFGYLGLGIRVSWGSGLMIKVYGLWIMVYFVFGFQELGFGAWDRD